MIGSCFLARFTDLPRDSGKKETYEKGQMNWRGYTGKVADSRVKNENVTAAYRQQVLIGLRRLKQENH